MDDTPLCVVIVGAGPVGLALAASLATGRCSERLQLRVLEPRGSASWDPQHVDLRVYALSRASQRILHNLGVWKTLAEARVSPYRSMQVWQGEAPHGLSRLRFDSAEIGEPDLGHVVEDRLLRSALLERIGQCANVELSLQTGLTAVDVRQRAVEVTTETGETLSAAVLVAADGSASPVRSLLGLPFSGCSYGQHAVVTHVASARAHAETAWQRFLHTGPLALLPLLDGRSSVVWSTTSRHAQALMSASDDEFLRELQAASGGVLGELGPVAERASFALRALHAPRYCRASVALAGDAAHTVHPLAGQGMNLGLLDAACLADVIERSLMRGEHPGDLRVLRRYERQRKGDNLGTLLALDALHRLFGLPGAFAALGGLGLGVVNATPAAKRLLMRRALGIAGELPSRARAQIA